MDKNTLIELNGYIFRILLFRDNKIYVINCSKMIMPEAINKELLNNISIVSEEKLHSTTGFKPPLFEELNDNEKNIIHSRFALIMPLIAFIDDDILRSKMIEAISKKENVSKNTIRRYLIKYLVYNTKTALINIRKQKYLTQDEKNFRWALNKYFYTGLKRPLSYAYRMMLKQKYLDTEGNFIKGYPKYHKFRYFYSKYNKKSKEYITRDGLGDYNRNNRPLLGTIYELAPCIGTAMLDSTVCDIYLVDDAKNVIGRPILTAAVDAYSGLCLGYSIGFEGGVYSLENLMQNIIEDKVEHCQRFGIRIKQEEWNVDLLPLIMISDKGREYIGNTFNQISELGIKLIDLPPYRPELKSRVEKFFDIVQSLFKENIYRMGLIYPDFQERGGKDYRKDACLTLRDFNKIILHSIVTYNNSTIIDIPYDEEMIKGGIYPFPSTLWNSQKEIFKDNFIKIDSNLLSLTLLPRGDGRFTKKGLIFNKIRYRNDLFKEEFLIGGDISVSYNPDDASYVFVRRDGKFHKFELVSSVYKNLSFDEIDKLLCEQGKIVNEAKEIALLEKLKLSNQIELVTSQVDISGKANIRDIKITRKKEQRKNHKRVIEGGDN